MKQQEKDTEADEEHPVEEDIDDFADDAFSGTILVIQTSIITFYQNRKPWVINGIILLFLLAYFVYFGYAMYYEFGSPASIQLLWMTIVGVVFILIFKLNLWSKTFGYLLSKRKPLPKKISAGLLW